MQPLSQPPISHSLWFIIVGTLTGAKQHAFPKPERSLVVQPFIFRYAQGALPAIPRLTPDIAVHTAEHKPTGLQENCDL